LQRVRDLHEDVLQISQLLYSIGRHDSAVIKGIKCALSCLEICNDYMAPPLHCFQRAERRIVRQRLEQISRLKADGIRSIMTDYTN
jgi:4-hydroxy-tetrahydrodipicolinate synthase